MFTYESRRYIFGFPTKDVSNLSLEYHYKKKGYVATFLKHGYRLEKCDYRTIWPIVAFF